MNFATRNLDQSVAFYRTLLQAEPEKQFEDYALFVTDEPDLELALDFDKGAEISESAHYGLVVGSLDAVEAAINIFQAANLRTTVQREEACCYAVQSKVWVSDPDGRRWEVYTVHRDTERRDDRETACCRSSADAESCCVA